MPRYYDPRSKKIRPSKGRGYGVCVECGTRRIVDDNEWRSKFRPKCMACGGLLDKSDNRKRVEKKEIDFQALEERKDRQRKAHK